MYRDNPRALYHGAEPTVEQRDGSWCWKDPVFEDWCKPPLSETLKGYVRMVAKTWTLPNRSMYMALHHQG